MQMCFALCIVLVTLSRDAYGYLRDDMAETIQRCCNEGEALANGRQPSDCSSSLPATPGIPPAMVSMCSLAKTQCCKGYFQKHECDTGIDIAASTNSCDTTQSTSQLCCNGCLKGTEDGHKKGPKACVRGSNGMSGDKKLADDAFVKCCKKAAKNWRGDASSRSSNVISLSTLPSVCEDYAPNELCAHHCIPVPGSYKCECNPGFMLMADGRNCKEVGRNRCKPRNPCQHKCNDNGVEVKCSCRRGYELMSDGKSCQDIDECLLDVPVCLPETHCQNLMGTYRCVHLEKKGQCPPGFARNSNNNVCDDINECLLPNPPCPSYICENSVGGYKCGGVPGDPGSWSTSPSPKPAEEDRCPPGFTIGPSGECEDVDECVLHKDDCNPLSQFCINTHSSFYCQDKVSKRCPPGFKIDPRTNKCADIDECEDDGDICRPDQVCVNQLGQYDCKAKVADSRHRQGSQCPDGMTKRPGSSFCEDIDECADGSHLCDLNQNCLNTNGSYDCHCKLGYELDISTGACADVNECATGQHECTPQAQRCDNTVGSYLCIRIASCGTGYVLHHSTGECEDIDECALGTHNCGTSHYCFNLRGSFRCVRRRTTTTSTTVAPEYEYEYYDSEEENESPDGERNQMQPKSEPATTTTPKPEPPPTTLSTEVTTLEPNPDFNNIVPLPTTSAPIETIESVTHRIPEATEPPTEISRPDTTSEPPKPDIPEFRPIDIPERVEPQPTTSPIEPKIPQLTFEKPPEYIPIEELPRTPEETPRAPERWPVTPETRATTPDQWPLIPEEQTTSPEEVTRIPEQVSKLPEEEPRTPVTPQRITEEPPTYPPTVNQETYGINREQEPSTNESIQPDERPETTFVPSTDTGLKATDIPPYSVIVSVGQGTPTVTAVKQDDGSVVIDTNEVPKNHWTNIDIRPRECPFGFEADEAGACFDIDECATNRHSCSGLTEVCKNTIGGYTCNCAPGFRRDFVTKACDVITTSSSTTTTTTPPPPPPPTSTSKSYFWGYPEYHRVTVRPFRPRNLCDAGFHLNSKTGQCEDINECTNGQANCAAVEICVNTQGGYRCECPPNWRLDEIRHRCVPLRKNGQFPTGYWNEPVYPSLPSKNITTSGARPLEPEITNVEDRGSVFRCPAGYRLGQENTCVDINECLTGAAKCGAQQNCFNLPGGYTCNCPSGHRLIGDHECEDVDECALAGSLPVCSQNADCLNTVGSYQCKCHKGFRSAPVNDKVCVDVDECVESRQGSLCQHRCNNVWGSYRCSCHRGYRLNIDNSTCSDVDECTEFKSKIPCVGRCLNEPGSYRCTCPSGYRISEDKRSCIDIDECETGEAPCAKNGGIGDTMSDVCVNTRGSYRCHKITCPVGYQLENKHRCNKLERQCKPGDWFCTHQPTTISYNFITFVSNLYIPESKLNLFTMRGPQWQFAKLRFTLRLVDVNAPPSVKRKADINDFLLTNNNNEGLTSLVRPLEGPQSIELEMAMELYSREQFGGTVIAKLFIYVSEYEF